MSKHNSLPVHSKEILKGIPMPESIRWQKYPFERMEVGESVFSVKNLGGSAWAYGKKSGKKFITRQYTHEGVEGYMCWRFN